VEHWSRCCAAHRCRKTQCRAWSGRMREDFAAWAQRDLAQLKVCYLFLDGWYPRARIGKKRVRVPVLVTLGVCADGRG
jgi:transposase-like protein